MCIRDSSYGERKIIRDVSFTIPEGTTTAIVGPSGSGKTTLTSLMARFWDVDSGTVKLGGINVKDYALDSLMRNFSMVFQRVYLFNDSIENNIKFGKPDATHEEVVAAAKAVSYTHLDVYKRQGLQSATQLIPLPECTWLQTEKRPLTEYPCQ